jgi:hypothetical protein
MTKLPFNLTEADFHAVEIARCKNDFLYYNEEYVKIEGRGKEGLIIPFRLWPAQKEVARLFTIERLIQIMKANQLGLTWLIISYASWKLQFNPGFSTKAISETEIKAKEIVRRLSFILRNLPDWFIDSKKIKGTWYEDYTMSISFHHYDTKSDKLLEDSEIQTFASSPTAGAGFTTDLFLFDEWALQEYAREIWEYAVPTINRPDGGQVIGISTIERGTLFEDIWRGKNNFKKIFLGWFADPRRDQKWYDDTVTMMGRDDTLKHYPATPEEALAIPGGAFFSKFNSTIHIKQPLDVIPDWYIKYRVLDYGMDMLACYFIYLDAQGYGRIYREIYYPNLVIGEAAYKILEAAGAELPSLVTWGGLTQQDKQRYASTAKEKFKLTFAPPDLFNKSSHTGKEGAQVWYENGIPLMKSKNDFQAGCLAVNNWLEPITLRDEQTGLEYLTARLTIDEDCAPNLVRSLLNIQKDKHNANVYAKQPAHELTHAPDALRYFCTEIVCAPIDKQAEEKKKKAAARLVPYPSMTVDPYANDRYEDKQLIF